MAQYKFDAERYCRHNAGRMGKWVDGGDVATMIAEELAALKAAARHAMMSWSCDCKADKSEMFKQLARLCGEE